MDFKVAHGRGSDTAASEVDGSEGARVLLADAFARSQRAGRIIGTRTSDDQVRKGVDLEGVISADNGALRIQPLITPGWGRAGIAYGPFERRPGLTFGVFLLNGHNTAQSENTGDTFRQRVNQWLMGCGIDSRTSRLAAWLRSKRKSRMYRQLLWWRRITKDATPVEKVNENLAVGWFPSEVAADPRAEGDAFIMHATGPENGELWARSAGRSMAVVCGVQNLQIYYVVVLRKTGAAYYAASVPGANGLGVYPGMRPLAIDAANTDPKVYAALYQSTLGQIGFRLDTRVYATRVALLPEFAQWFGTAHAADVLTGSRSLQGSNAEVGGEWQLLRGEFERTARGVRGIHDDSLALLSPTQPTGLLHVLVNTNADASVALVWRFMDDRNHWVLSLSGSGSRLAVQLDGVWNVLARGGGIELGPDNTHAVQLTDDGVTIAAFFDGHMLFEKRFTDARLADACGVGMWIERKSGACFERFEAHPRSVPLPTALDVGKPWWQLGQRIVVSDGFEGAPRDLAGKTTTFGEKVWSRTIGTGSIDVTGGGSAKIRASVQKPNPGRTAYTIDWDQPSFADVEVTIRPAGTAPGEKEHGLCGLIFWQDPRNYVTINIWRYETYGGASISTFFQLDGFEDLYDAIWSNVGDRVYWGRPHRFRVVFDGMRYLAFVDDEPVLFRALTDVYANASRLQIRRVGLLANWEWGNDTGSTFTNFCGKV